MLLPYKPLAAERATFILTDGSRQSGLVAFHGTGNRNIIDNFLNLAEAQGPDKTIPAGSGGDYRLRWRRSDRR